LKDLITIGKIVKQIGLGGRLKAVSYLASGETITRQQSVFIGHDVSSAVSYRITGITIKGKTILLSLEGIETVEASANLKGRYLFLPRNALDPLEEDEYFWEDIIGLEVVNEDGEKLGVITSIIATGSNDVYVCEGPGGETLLPAVEGFIKKIDIHGGIVVASLPREL
jgi:16S rRNA processing protein RimM